MFEKISRVDLIMFLVFFAAVSAPRRTLAQPPQEAPFDQQIKRENAKPMQWHALKVHHVRPGMVAWWLDPEHQPEPLEVSHSRKTQRMMNVNADKLQALLSTADRGKANGDKKAGVLNIFENGNIRAITFSDIAGDVLVLANEDGWESFQTVVKYLDRPIKQVEIRLTVIEMNDDDANALNWKRDANVAGPVKIPTAQFEEIIENLRANDQVQVINSPRFTTLNNMPGESGQSQYVGAALTLDTGLTPEQALKLNGNFYPPARISFSPKQFMMGRRSTFIATPTINNDGSITLMFTYATPLFLARSPDIDTAGELVDPQITQRSAFGEFLLETSNNLTTVVKLMPDETLLCANLGKSTSIPATTAGAAPQTETRNVFYFVSARDVTRATPELLDPQ